jgi:hypothetical protein
MNIEDEVNQTVRHIRGNGNKSALIELVKTHGAIVADIININIESIKSQLDRRDASSFDGGDAAFTKWRGGAETALKNNELALSLATSALVGHLETGDASADQDDEPKPIDILSDIVFDLDGGAGPLTWQDLLDYDSPVPGFDSLQHWAIACIRDAE